MAKTNHTPEQLRALVEHAGARYLSTEEARGAARGVEFVFFEDPLRDTVLPFALPVEGLTAQRVQFALYEARQEAKAALAERIDDLRALKTRRVANRDVRLIGFSVLALALANALMAWQFAKAGDAAWAIAHGVMTGVLVGLWTLTRAR